MQSYEKTSPSYCIAGSQFPTSNPLPADYSKFSMIYVNATYIYTIGEDALNIGKKNKISTSKKDSHKRLPSGSKKKACLVFPSGWVFSKISIPFSCMHDHIHFSHFLWKKETQVTY